MSIGTRFEVFVAHEKKKARAECMDAWTGHDPFSQGYESSQIKRDIIALTIQILLDIDSQLEDLLFPIYVTMNLDLGEAQEKLLETKLTKIVFNMREKESLKEGNLKKHMCWIYQIGEGPDTDENVKRFDIEGGVCQVDLTQMKIYLWLDDLAVSACLGVDFVARDNFQSIQSPCKIYYKGILIGERDINKSGNLLEYINIQERRKGRNLIQLSRNGFTQEGLVYIDTVLIPRIYKSLFDVLKTLAGQEFVQKEKADRISFAEKIKRNIKAALNHDAALPEKSWQKQLVGISLYYNFYMREFENRNFVYLSKKDEAEMEQWENVIREVSLAVSVKRNEAADMEIHSRLKVIEVYADLLEKSFQVMGKREITIADFYRKENKFAVVSKRRDTGDKWINSLIWLKNSENRTDKTPALIEALELAATERNKRQGWTEQLENWAEFMLENMFCILESQPIQQSNFVLALLQSVSISACFSDAAGNFKIHILSGHSRGNVYYNIHAKYKLLKHMAARKETASAERFAGNVWMGYELLKVPRIPEDICSIKEQYIQGSETYMIFPCSGQSVQKLIHFAETWEEKHWPREHFQEGEQSELAAYLTEAENRLRNVAENLYSCIVIEYNYAKKYCERLFSEQYVDYCKEQKVRVSEDSFWELLNSGYSLALGHMLKEELANRTEGREQDPGRKKSVNLLSVKELKEEIEVWLPQKLESEYLLFQEEGFEWIYPQSKQEGKRLPYEEEINELRKKIGIGVLQNYKAIIEGWRVEEDSGLLNSMIKLLNHCFEWDSVWKIVQDLEMELESQVIKAHLLARSEGNENLNSWVSDETHNDLNSVAECYDRMWDELIEAVLKRRKNSIKSQHFNLLDWMRKKE